MAATSPPTKFKVGLVQMSMTADPAANLAKAIAQVKVAAQQGAALVCLPELFRTLYIGQREDHALFDLAEPVPGPSTEALGNVAKQAGVVVIASLFERRAAGLYHNTAAVIEADGTVKGIYRKMHIPDDPAYYEKFYFTPGDLGFRAFDTSVGSIGALICWDQWYPEGARLTALQGAEFGGRLPTAFSGSKVTERPAVAPGAASPKSCGFAPSRGCARCGCLRGADAPASQGSAQGLVRTSGAPD